MQKQTQNIKLLGGQVHRTAAFGYDAAVQIHRDVLQHHLAAALVVAAQHHLHPGLKFGHIKGLDDVVLRPQAQALYPVPHLGAGGEKNHRRVILADVFHQFKAAGVGQHHIQQDQIEPPPFDPIRSFIAVAGNGAAITCLGEAHADEVGNGGFVLHDQNVIHDGGSFPGFGLSGLPGFPFEFSIP